MVSKQAEQQDRRVKWALLISSLVCCALLSSAALNENLWAEWVQVRGGYAALLHEKATDERGSALAEQFEVRVIQHISPAYGTTDRCATCHAGVDDPRMVDAAQPYRVHPGRWVEIHAPEQFGCTVCHGGQGLATVSADAHGVVDFWDQPLLGSRYLYSSCAQCHAEETLYGADGLIARGLQGEVSEAASMLALGRALTQSRGCLGCHKLDGKGGTLGPALDFVGDKTRHDLDFSNVEHAEGAGVAEWLRMHFLDPDAVSPGSVMPKVATTDFEADALTAYMLSLRTPLDDVRIEGVHAQLALTEGPYLYARYCSACHGPEGTLGDVPDINTPSLRNLDAQAVASDDYYRLIIGGGKSGTHMPAWEKSEGGLSREEIDTVVDFLRGWQEERSNIEFASSRQGKVRRGRAYYQGLCANCHGGSGEGGLGNALRPETFLALASDDFLARTIVEGRPGTAMPAWRHLSTQAVSDLLAYLRSWQSKPPSLAEVEEKLQSVDHGTLAAAGKHIFRGNCAGCHGTSGEGALGPALNGPNIVSSVDTRYLYRAISEGRPGTAMPSWRAMTAYKQASLIAYLRSWQPEIPALKPVTLRGDPMVGEVHFLRSCAGCHGSEGQGGMGPQLLNSVFIDSVSDATLLEWIGHGRKGTAMRGFLPEAFGVTRMDREDIADVVAWMREAGSRGQPLIKREGTGDAVLGGELFAGNCAACHGVHGEGASGPQLNNSGFLAAASDGFLTGTIAMGRSGTPMQSMVHGGGGIAQIEPEQVRDVVAYLRQWEPETNWRVPRRLAEQSYPTIRAGRELFTSHCSGCHGPNGKGSQEGEDYFAPALNNPEFLRAASDGFLTATIARGRQGTPMRPFGDQAGGISSLSGDDIADLVSAIRAWQDEPTSTASVPDPQGGSYATD